MEEFGPEFIYLKRLANNLAYSLSRLDMGSEVTQALCYLEGKDVTFKELNDIEQAEMFDALADEKIANTVFLLSTQVIAHKQAKDSQLYSMLTLNSAYFQKKVEGVTLIHMEGKICIPQSLHSQVLLWYYDNYECKL